MRLRPLIVVAGSLVLASPTFAGPMEDAVAAYNAKDYATTFRLLKPLAEAGDRIAQKNLGLLYRDGQGVAQDDAEAAKWFRKAADQGVAAAQFELGRLIVDGKGVAKDVPAGADWIQKAADQGNPPAERVVCFSYILGSLGPTKNPEQAFPWCQRASTHGDAAAQDNLGAMYANGVGVAEDRIKAEFWWRRAANQGYADAQGNLGLLYMNGIVLQQNNLQAYEWYLLATNAYLKTGQKDREHSFKSRDSLAATLTPEQKRQADEWVRNWVPHPEH